MLWTSREASMTLKHTLVFQVVVVPVILHRPINNSFFVTKLILST